MDSEESPLARTEREHLARLQRVQDEQLTALAAALKAAVDDQKKSTLARAVSDLEERGVTPETAIREQKREIASTRREYLGVLVGLSGALLGGLMAALVSEGVSNPVRVSVLSLTFALSAAVSIVVRSAVEKSRDELDDQRTPRAARAAQAAWTLTVAHRRATR